MVYPKGEVTLSQIELGDLSSRRALFLASVKVKLNNELVVSVSKPNQVVSVAKPDRVVSVSKPNQAVSMSIPSVSSISSTLARLDAPVSSHCCRICVDTATACMYR